MDILKIAAFALCAAILASASEKYTPWVSVLISLGAGTVIMLYLMPSAKLAADRLKTLFSLTGGDSGYITLLLKVIGISFVAQISSQICADAGQKAIGDKIETAARIFIAVCTLPLISDMLKLITDFLGG